MLAIEDCCSFITNLVGGKRSGRGKKGTDVGREVSESLSGQVIIKLRAKVENDVDV